MLKCIYFTAGPIATAAEKAEIAALRTRVEPELEIRVRNAEDSQAYGAGIEDADYVLGTRPDAYTSTETYPALPDSIGDIAQGAEITVNSGEVKSQGTLTIAEPVTAGDTMTIGATEYTFVTGATAAAGEIGIGANEAATKLAIVAAINGVDGFNSANASVSAAAFDGDDCVLTAKAEGVAGDAVVTTETFTHVSNVFDAGTLGTTTAGVDPAKEVTGTAELNGASLDHVDLPEDACVIEDGDQVVDGDTYEFTVSGGVITGVAVNP